MPRYPGVRRHGNRWQISYQVPGREPPRVFESLQASSAKHAAEIRAARIREVAEGSWLPPEDRHDSGLELYDLIDRFLASYRSRQGRVEYYEWCAVAWRSLLPDMRLSRLTPEVLEEYRDARLAVVSPSTVRKELAAMATMFKWALRRGLWRRDPTQHVRRPPEPRHQAGYLTEAQEEALLEAAPPWLQLVIEWAINTGMDRAEVIALRWSQIDEAQETCWCPRHKTGQGRVLPLNIVHLGILKRAKRVRSIADGGHVFLGAEGKPLTADTVRCALRRAYAKAKLDIPAPFKTLRHTFGARLAMRGVPMRAIAELMGHSTQAVTERYAHLSPEYLREAMGALERLPQSPAPQQLGKAEERRREGAD